MTSEQPQPGTLIDGKYEVERLLGQGGMGAVYVVRHTVTHKRLALKQLLPDVSGQTYADRFVREARAAGRIQHRHVVDIFDVGSDESGLYMVMELLEGKPLSELLEDESLALHEALVVLSRAMQGVAAAHASGVIHRDLKPDNIFVCQGPSGQLDDPRVLDFGISKSQADPNLTESGVMLGTPYYMSPEQVYARRDIDARTDVYTMGVILYEAIAGRRPFEAESVSALAVMIATADFTPLHELRPDVPEGLCAVIEKALSREREDRFESMDALVAAIEPYIPSASGYALPSEQVVPLRTPRSGERVSLGTAPTDFAESAVTGGLGAGPRRWARVALLVLLGVGVGVGGWLLSRSAPLAAPEPDAPVGGAPTGEPGAPSGAKATQPPGPARQDTPAAVDVSAEPTAAARVPPESTAGDEPSNGDEHAADAPPEPSARTVPRKTGRGQEGAAPRERSPRKRRPAPPAPPRTGTGSSESPTAPEPQPAAFEPPPASAPAAEGARDEAEGQAHGRAGTLGVEDF